MDRREHDRKIDLIGKPRWFQLVATFLKRKETEASKKREAAKLQRMARILTN